MARLHDGIVLDEEEAGIVRRYRVVDGLLFEPRGRKPTAQEMDETEHVMLRPAPKIWGLRADYTPKRVGGPPPS